MKKRVTSQSQILNPELLALHFCLFTPLRFLSTWKEKKKEK